MIVYDPLYGRFEVPQAARVIVQTPEFRRLSQIRLLNTISPTLATLGEVRRYSHTLGVVYLETLWEKHTRPKFSRRELDAFQASIILHDIGTPPFGHLFEYILRERTGWNHEAVIVDVLRGQHAPENTAHQFFAARTLKIIKILEKSRIDRDVILGILTNRHPLSQLILGRLDFDNVDNVARMAWALGLPGGADVARSLSLELGVTNDGRLACAQESRQRVLDWMDMRRRVYEVIVFDPQTVAAQAVLTKALWRALEDGLLGVDDWSLTDEELLARLQESSATKDLVNQQYLGILPSHVFTMQITKSVEELGFGDRHELMREVESQALKAGVTRPVAYVFQDRGTFEKSVEFIDTEDGQSWSIGTTSHSTVVYLFSQSQTPTRPIQLSQLVNAITNTIQIHDADIVRLLHKTQAEGVGEQARLSF